MTNKDSEKVYDPDTGVMADLGALLKEYGAILGEDGVLEMPTDEEATANPEIMRKWITRVTMPGEPGSAEEALGESPVKPGEEEEEKTEPKAVLRTKELAEDLKAIHGVDVMEELTKIEAGEIISKVNEIVGVIGSDEEEGTSGLAWAKGPDTTAIYRPSLPARKEPCHRNCIHEISISEVNEGELQDLEKADRNLIKSWVKQWMKKMAIDPFLENIVEADNGDETGLQLIDEMLEEFWTTGAETSEDKDYSDYPDFWLKCARKTMIDLAGIELDKQRKEETK